MDVLFIGDWYKEKKLGSGGFGSVELWKNKKTNACVAIKRMNSSIFGDNADKNSEHIIRWNNEIELMTTKIQHPHIVRTVDLKGSKLLEDLKTADPRKTSVLALEFCEGGDLRKVLHRSVNCNGLSELEVRDILKSLSSAIGYLHSLNIIHRDIKPENIVLKKENDRIIYKLTDLGYAKPLDKQSKTTLAGTMEYLAPELLISDKYNFSVDYWSFGIIAFEIICGCRPFIPHVSLATWMLHVQQKKSDHICITEENNETFKYHSKIFPENHITKALKPHMEKWLMTALEWNPKQRGFVFERGSSAITDTTAADPNTQDANKSKPKVKFSDEIGKGPQQILKIFSGLDEAFKRKFLTIFCLHTYKFFELEIDATTTMQDLYTGVERATGIPKTEIDVILSLQQQIESITPMTKPLELFIPNWYDQPMLFVGRTAKLLSDVTPNVSVSIQEVFQNVKTKFRPHCLKKFVVDSFYFIGKEQKKYSTFLDGLKNHGLLINEVILKQKTEIQKMLKLVYGLNGALEMFVITLSQTKENIEDKKLMDSLGSLVQGWEEQSTRLEFNVLKLTEATNTINKRYESVLKRSREVLVNNLLKNPHEDVFDLTTTTNDFEKVRALLQEKKTHEKSHIDMLQNVYECLKRRDALLKSFALKELQQHLINVKIEMEEIRKTIEKAIQQGDKYKFELMTINTDLHDQMWKIFENNGDLPDLERMLEQPRAIESMNLMNGSFRIGAQVTPNLKDANGQSLLCFGEGVDATSLIADNETLILATEDLIQDGFKQLNEF